MRPGISALSILCLIPLQVGVLTAQEGPSIFEMPRLNQVYSNVVREVLPIRQGPITVRLNFLEHSMELKDHRLEVLRDSESSSYNFRVVVTLQGEAEVESHLEMVGLPASLKDQIHLPLQTISVSGRAEVRRDDEGFHISPQELP